MKQMKGYIECLERRMEEEFTVRQKEDADEKPSPYKEPPVLKRTASISSVAITKSSDLEDKLTDKQILMMSAEGNNNDAFMETLANTIRETGSRREPQSTTSGDNILAMGRKERGTTVRNDVIPGNRLLVDDDGQDGIDYSLLRDRSIFVLNDANSTNDENSPLMMSDNEARKALKGIKWPEFDDKITIDTFKRIFQLQIDSAKNKNIPDDMIKDSIVQHLMSSKCMAEFANLTQEIPPSSLENVIKIIHRLDPEGQCMEPEERFGAIKMLENESAIAFIKRLQTAFRDIFKINALGETRRIRNQFIENFTKGGVKLNEEEKRSLYTCSDLTDLAISAKRAMERQNENWQGFQNLNHVPLEPQINCLWEYPQYPIPPWGNRDIEPNAQDISPRMLVPSSQEPKEIFSLTRKCNKKKDR